jgi:GTP cyclohydrolase I
LPLVRIKKSTNLFGGFFLVKKANKLEVYMSIELKKGFIEDHIRAILELVGENPNREGLSDTPKRVAKKSSYRIFAKW